jgi:hypothetical protein
LPGGRLDYLEQLSCLEHGLDLNRFQIKIQKPFWTWIWFEFKGIW